MYQMARMADTTLSRSELAVFITRFASRPAKSFRWNGHPAGRAEREHGTRHLRLRHTDSVGSDAYNQKLSVRRSEAVKAYLVSKGIEKNRVYTEGKGEKQPVADNKTSEGRAKNRRVEIEVVGTRAAK